jgi:hypothetical protein
MMKRTSKPWFRWAGQSHQTAATAETRFPVQRARRCPGPKPFSTDRLRPHVQRSDARDIPNIPSR